MYRYSIQSKKSFQLLVYYEVFMFLPMTCYKNAVMLNVFYG